MKVYSAQTTSHGKVKLPPRVEGDFAANTDLSMFQDLMSGFLGKLEKVSLIFILKL